MKSFKILMILFLAGTIISCDEQKILEEIPLDFYSPENSFRTPEHFETAVTNLYYLTRQTFYLSSQTYCQSFRIGTDFGRDARAAGSFSFGDYPSRLTSSSGFASYWWSGMYELISCANTILNRITDVEFPTDSEKNAVIAEARFFRGFAYRVLAYTYGGVPIELEEVTSPKRDYTRASRAEVYQQSIEDLVFATQNLPDISNVKADGRISKEAANHYLAELYLATQQWDKAVTAASQVIDNPNLQLMTVRFGRRLNVTPRDVWWDLFQKGNQNRSSGNKEAIWVMQHEYNIPGGGDGFRNERVWCCWYWNIKDPKGVSGFIGPTSQNYGRGAGTAGTTTYWAKTIWESDWNNDLRNSEYNLVRDFVYDNPKSTYYGKKVSEFPAASLDRRKDFYPFQSKITTPGDHPDELYADKTTGLLLSSAMVTYSDQYYARLAETYLIRAEAYLGKGDKTKAAADINKVRTRVNATPVASGDVTIDYILDERLRELAYEEHRRLTLARLGMVYERTSKYNDYDDGKTIQPYHELFPIPYSEIERNTEAVLEQNPGYDK